MNYFYYDVIPLGERKLFLSQSPRDRKAFDQFLKDNSISYAVNLLSDEDNIKYGYTPGWYQATQEVIFYPITDYGIPRDPSTFKDLIKRISELIRNNNILIHCHAGCGRTGMVTVALMIMLEPQRPVKTHIFTLRDIRPCAIDTSQQIEFLNSFREQILSSQ